jgi:hypothetical protein
MGVFAAVVLIFGVLLWQQDQRLDCWDTWHEVAELREADPDSPYLALDCWKDYE